MSTEHPWSASELVPTTSADNQEPALAIIANTLHAVWVSDKTLYHALCVDGQWQAPVRFASGEQPTLAAGADGSLHCAFAQWFLGNCEIYTARWDAAGWSLPQLVSRTSGISTQPAICVSQEDIHVVWADTTPGRSTIYYAQPRGVAWANAPLPNGAGSRPALAISSAGETCVAWQDRLAQTGYFEVFAAVYRAGAWSLPEIISDNPTHHSLSPALAVNAQGTCHLVWQEERNGRYVIRHAERLPGGWALPVDISWPGNDARLSRVATAPKGFLQALWVEGSLLKHRARAAEQRALWWKEEVACADCAGISDLAIAVAPDTGELHALWSAYADTDQRRLYHARRAPMIRHTVFIPIVPGPK